MSAPIKDEPTAMDAADNVSMASYEALKKEMAEKTASLAEKAASLVKEKEAAEARASRFEAHDLKLVKEKLVPTVQPFLKELVAKAPEEWQSRMAMLEPWPTTCAESARVDDGSMGMMMALHVASAESAKRSRESEATSAEQMGAVHKKCNELEESNGDLSKRLKESVDLAKERYETIGKLMEELAKAKPGLCTDQFNFSAKSNREVSEGGSSDDATPPQSKASLSIGASLAADIMRSSSATSRVFAGGRSGGAEASQLSAAIAAANA